MYLSLISRQMTRFVKKYRNPGMQMQLDDVKMKKSGGDRMKIKRKALAFAFVMTFSSLSGIVVNMVI